MNHFTTAVSQSLSGTTTTWVRCGNCDAWIAVESYVDIAVVSTNYEVAGRGSGRVGVIGPMRMDYRRTISVVEEVGDGLAESLGS